MESAASICFYAVNSTSNKNIPIKTCKPISRSKAGEKGEFHRLSSEVILQEHGAKTGATKKQKNAHTYFTTLLCGSKALNLARRISFLFRKKFVEITVNRKPFRQCFFALEFRFGEPFEGVAKFCFDFRRGISCPYLKRLIRLLVAAFGFLLFLCWILVAGFLRFGEFGDTLSLFFGAKCLKRKLYKK